LLVQARPVATAATPAAAQNARNFRIMNSHAVTAGNPAPAGIRQIQLARAGHCALRELAPESVTWRPYDIERAELG
jgi:hypothetical protein